MRGVVWHGWARRGVAGQGKAWDFFDPFRSPWLGVARHGEARHGTASARQCVAMRGDGEARHGIASDPFRKARRGTVRRGNGVAWRGWARFGAARFG
jgi:hypothetical protein